jgi:succinate dehydrogenase / fumarate reductase cytochrome b subunit
MSSAAEATTTTKRADPSFLHSRLGSLLAVVPLGVWTIAHLWHNLSAFQGAAAWERDVTAHESPIAFFVTTTIALLPLGLHTVWGIGRILSVRPNNTKYTFYANLKYALQRLSAMGLVGFLGAHVFKAMIEPRAMHGRAEPFDDIATMMNHHLPTLVVYILGVAGIAFHLANGLQSFSMGWGIVTSRHALKKLEWLVAIVFVAILAMGLATIYALWSAGSTLPPPHV